MLTSSNPFSGGALLLRTSQMNRLAMNQAMYRLATGYRINAASDDPAGTIASSSLNATLAALNAETDANERAVNVVATADAGLSQISDLLNTAKSLSQASANDAGLSDDEKQANQMEIDSILQSVDRIAGNTSFLGTKLLDGSATISASGHSLSIPSAATDQIGTTDSNGTTYTLSDIRSGGTIAATGDNPELTGQVIDAAINDVATIRAHAGAFTSNTLEPRLSQINSARTNMLAAISMIQDTDYAFEVSAKVRSDLLLRTSTLLQNSPATSRLYAILGPR